MNWGGLNVPFSIAMYQTPPKIPQEEHLMDVRKSANIGHLRDENHLIDVHLAEMWAPDDHEEEEAEEVDDDKEE